MVWVPLGLGVGGLRFPVEASTVEALRFRIQASVASLEALICKKQAG